MVGIGSGLSLAEHSHPELKDSADKVRTKVASPLLGRHKGRTFLTDLVRHFVRHLNSSKLQAKLQPGVCQMGSSFLPVLCQRASAVQVSCKSADWQGQPQFGDDQEE